VFTSITASVTRHPWRVIVAWILAALALGMVGQAKVADVTTSDTASFLPSRYESVRAAEFGRQAFGHVEGSTTVTVLVKPRDGGRLTASDGPALERAAAGLRGWRPDWSAIRHDPPKGTPAVAPNDRQRETRVVGIDGGGVDPHHRFALVAAQFKGNSADPLVQAAFKQFRDDASATFARHGFRAGYTGGVASMTDTTDANRSTEALESLLLFAAVILLNLVFFRGVLAAIVPLIGVTLVTYAATGVVVAMASAFGFTLDISTPQLITTVLIGIGTDYFLFLMFRFREQLRSGDGRREAAATAGLRVGHVIASAALAVSVAFATLGLASFGQFRSLGPSVAASVLVMLVAGVTLMPALLAATGRALFWPAKRWRRERAGGFAARLGAFVGHRPRVAALVSAGLLVVLASGAIATKMSYDLQSEPHGTQAARVSAEIARSLPRGATDPQTVYVRADRTLTTAELRPMQRRLRAVDGVGQVGPAVLTADRHGAAIGVVLTAESTSQRGMETAGGPLRRAAHAAAPAGTDVMVGGTASAFADVSRSISHDLKLIFPLAAGLILLILVALLRSVVAPVYLLAAVGLEFAATLGAAVTLFQGALGEAGVAFTLPLVLFLFVVALGTDYNMLIAARMREEMRTGRPVADAVAEAVRRSAPAIAAAGLILASSFGTLLMYPDEGTRQMGFAMATGILLASLVVSTLLVPAITALAGQRAWWPGATMGRRRRHESRRSRRADRSNRAGRRDRSGAEAHAPAGA
jgi:RND superfamily putative drug exporter